MMIDRHESTCDPAARLCYEKRLRIAAAALAIVLRREFALLCKDPEKVRELAEVEELLAETHVEITGAARHERE